MHSPFNGSSAALGCTACCCRCQTSWGQWCGQSGPVVVGMKLPFAPGNHRLECGSASGNGAWNRRGEAGRKLRIPVFPSLHLLSSGLVALLDRGRSRRSITSKKGVNPAAAGTPEYRCWCFKTKTHLEAHLCRCQKCSKWLFWEILAFHCFPNEVLN